MFKPQYLLQLSNCRLDEAKVLIASNCYQGAYYLAGYSVELLLKAVAAKIIIEPLFNEDLVKKEVIKKILDKFYVHNLNALREYAGMPPPPHTFLKDNWEKVALWSEQARYKLDITEQEANAILDAITDSTIDPITQVPNGVNAWIRTYL